MKNSLLILITFLIACESEKKASQTAYKEKFRPQFHFSPQSQWMNDPNGMVYYQNEYHLFYQYYPDSNVWGPMHWGHAVSKDLIYWEHLPIALYPDSLGYIFSGSAVVDWKNTSGLGTSENPPLVAIFTYHDAEKEKNGSIDFQTQGIAYSLDKGRNWTKYEGNPVLPNPGIRDFRDPKVFWYEAEEKWIMILAIWDHVALYSSKDLKKWSHESEFGKNWGSHAGVWECPDLFPLKVENSENYKWVLLLSINPGGPQEGSATQYFVGDFDGHQFTLDENFKKDLFTTTSFFPEGTIFDDFEKGLRNWESTGSAFKQEKIKEKDFVNSALLGDSATGTLLSSPFEITQPYINLYVGGGNDNIRTFVALQIEGKEIKKSSGGNSSKLHIVSWDVSEYVGQKAQIQIVDNSKGGWGHILVDDIVFSSQSARPERENAVWLDYGADNYAGVTWSDVPENKRLFMGWMSNWQYAQIVPTYQWRSAMTLPRRLILKNVNDTYRLQSTPLRAIEKILGEKSTNATITDSLYLIKGKVDGDFSLYLENEKKEKVAIICKNKELTFDRSQSGIVDFHASFKNKHKSILYNEAQTIAIFVDKASIELFINDGELTMTEIVFPSEPYHKIKAEGVKNLEIYPIKSIWR